MEPKTGLGHQYKADEKVIEACKKSLMEGFIHLFPINNPDVDMLKFEIQQLINKCIQLSYSAREKSKLNQD